MKKGSILQIPRLSQKFYMKHEREKLAFDLCDKRTCKPKFIKKEVGSYEA